MCPLEESRGPPTIKKTGDPVGSPVFLVREMGLEYTALSHKIKAYVAFVALSFAKKLPMAAVAALIS